MYPAGCTPENKTQMVLPELRQLLLLQARKLFTLDLDAAEAHFIDRGKHVQRVVFPSPMRP